MVCSVDHLASAAGLAMLERGGSAADAAIAANAVLAVVAPHMCGLGGDLFALVHDGATVTALNASGRAGSGADPARLRAEGHTRMPHLHDIRSVTVPGCVDGWASLHGRHGRLPMAELLAPAIRLASAGFPASPLMVAGAASAARRPGGGDFASVRAAGDRVTRPGVARALQALAGHGRNGFYLGEFGQGLVEAGAGEYVEADLAAPGADWVEPLRTRAHGHDVWSMPPNSQGYLLLMSLAIAEGLDLPASPSHPVWAHLLAESARIAGHDRLDVLHEDTKDLLDPAEITRRRSRIDSRSRLRLGGPGQDGDTTYLCVIDGDGMGGSRSSSRTRPGSAAWCSSPVRGSTCTTAASASRSSPVTRPSTGRAAARPTRSPPALITRPDGSLRSVVGTMGGDAQPQVLLQVITRLLRHGEEPGRAIAAPRWRLGTGGTGFDTWDAPDDAVLDLEEGGGWSDGLAALGHRVAALPYGSSFGHAHLIDVRPDGMLAGAADPRSLVGAAIGR
ncbi:gamma-glutamyltransferase family protein [Nonomuraea salmonea]